LFLDNSIADFVAFVKGKEGKGKNNLLRLKEKGKKLLQNAKTYVIL
jgi:hypothetical protein